MRTSKRHESPRSKKTGWFRGSTPLLLALLLALALFPDTAYAFPNPLSGLGDAFSAAGSTLGAVKDLINTVVGLFVTLPFFIFLGPLLIATIVIGGLATFLSFTMTEFIKSTLSIPVTPAGQEIVRIGSDITLNLANMFIVLLFVIIGLATILRLQNYQMSKLLPTLIIIALLVNFSGVLVGFVVDIGNLFTAFFLDKTASFETLSQQVGGEGIVGQAWDFLTGGVTNALQEGVTLAAQIVSYLLYYIISVLVMFIVMLLFFVRIVVLWIIAILAPLAFVAYAFPSTKRFWNQWFSNLIQWSIIGVPISLFLYLSSQMLGLNATIPIVWRDISNPGDLMGNVVQAIASLINLFLVPFAALIMMVVGIGLSLTLAPAGAQGVINFGKKAGIGLGLAAGTAAWRRIGSPLEGSMEKARAWAEKQEGLGAEKMRSGGLGFVTGGLQRLGGTATKLSAAGYGLGFGKISELTRAHDEPEIAAERKAGQNIAAVDNIQEIATEMAKGPLADMNKVIGRVMALGDNGDTNDLYDELAKPGGKLNWDNMARAYDAAKQRGTPFRRHMEKMFIADALDEKDEQGTITRQNRLGVDPKDQSSILEMGRITPQDIAGKLIDPRVLDPETEKGARLLDTLMVAQGNTLMPAISRIPNREVRNNIGSYLNSKDPEWFVKNNVEDILVWSTSPAAQSIGISGIGGLDTRDKVKAFINERKFTTKSEDELHQEMERHKTTLAEVEERKAANRGKYQSGDQRLENLAKQGVAKIEAELRIKALSPTQVKEALDMTEANLTRLSRSRELGRVADTEFYARKKEYQDAIDRFERELKATPSENQPTSVQIAEVEAKIAALKPRAGGKVRGRVVQETGVSLPGGGMRYQPGRRARGDVKKLQETLEDLRKEQGALSPAMRTIEDIILEDQTRVQAKRGTISSLEKGLENLASREREINEKLQELGSLPASDSRVAEIRSGLEEIWQNKREAEQTLTRIRESLQRDRDRIQESTNAWKGLKEASAGADQKTTSQIIQGQIQKIKDEETEAMSVVTRMRAAKVAPEDLRAAQKTLDDIRASRNRWEERLRAEGNSAQGRGGRPRQGPSGPPPGGGTPPPTSPSSPRRPRPGSGGPGAGATPSPTPTSGATTPPSPASPSPSSSPAPSGGSRSAAATDAYINRRRAAESPTPPASPSATQQTPRRSGTPTWLRKGLDDMRGEKGVPGQITGRLRQYLNSRGVTNDEVTKMTPRQAWQRADEFSKEG